MKQGTREMLDERGDVGRTMADTTYRRLRHDIVAGRLNAGSKLKLEGLAGDYEVGMSPLREALTRLVGDLLVVSEGQRGFWVAPLSLDELEDISRVRALIETEALNFAIRNGDAAWEAAVRQAFDELTEVERQLPQTADALSPELLEDWERCNRAFHAALVSASGSPMLIRFRDQLYRQSERYRRVSLNVSRRWRNVHDEHAAIFDATMQRNALKAARMTELHMSRTAEEVRRAMQSLTGDVAPAAEKGPPVSFDLTGQRILVTGAAGGIGAAIAIVLAGLGARLVLTDRISCAAQVDALRASGREVDEIVLDLDSAAAVAELATRAGDLDGAVLGAGIYRPVDWDSEQWDEVASATLATNLMMPMRLARELTPRMAARGGGRMVLLGSIVAITGGSFPGVGPHYAASKGGLHTIVRWLAARYGGDGVLINGVAPGITNTAMVSVHDLSGALQLHPLKRAARPEEIAWPVAFLCSPAASFISGAILDVNGGAMMRP